MSLSHSNFMPLITSKKDESKLGLRKQIELRKQDQGFRKR